MRYLSREKEKAYSKVRVANRALIRLGRAGRRERYNSLPKEVQEKIKHTWLHNQSIQRLAREKGVRDNRRYVEHDMDKIVMYLYKGNLEKHTHKKVASHHKVKLTDLLKGVEYGGAYEEALLDYESSLLSKPSKTDTAYETVELKYKGNKELLKYIESKGFYKKSKYPAIKESEYREIMKRVSWEAIEVSLRRAGYC